MLRMALVFIMSLLLAGAAIAQDPDRSATGGAQTLEDILARQAQQQVDDTFRRDATGDPNAQPQIGDLATRGGTSDPEIWRALRYGQADITTQARGPVTDMLVQDSGMAWLNFRRGPLATWGGWGLIGTLGALALFYLLRGKIRIDGKLTGKRVMRFSGFERFCHWLMAGSFILLGITGLITLFGRMYLIPVLGKDSFATLAEFGKLIHNNVAWAFIVSLIGVFVIWLRHNIPNRTDLTWMAQAGGLFSKGKHPPARKFNAGQKIIYWSVIVLGASISLSGLSLLFPFDLPMFGKTFAVLNQTGLPAMLGYPLPETLTPYQEMQLSQIWHGIVAFVFMMIILAHIYLGSVGMQGAFDAMGSGKVEAQWAKEHHSLWYEDVTKDTPTTPPAE